MVIVILILVGLCLGSFVNALVWRTNAQTQVKSKRSKVKGSGDLSILKGRSMCVNCRHALAWYDLVPVFSWLMLGGRCRYCRKRISWQYPVVELVTSMLFVVSYVSWSSSIFNLQSSIFFVLWLLILTGLVALFVYDIRWMLLPNSIVFPLIALSVLMIVTDSLFFGGGWSTILEAALGLAFCGGIFYALFIISNGRWIGGGDVKLGFLLGIVVGGPLNALLVIFGASLIGSIVAVPLLIKGSVKARSRLPFGPFLITAAVVINLFGETLIKWYETRFLFM